MKVTVSLVGVLENLLPGGEDVIEAESFTIQELLDRLVKKHGSAAAERLIGSAGLREGLSLLVNGQNALSLPERFQTRLRDEDEVVITVQVTGGKTRREG
jgi:molybdopterin converting factor small subunit